MLQQFLNRAFPSWDLIWQLGPFIFGYVLVVALIVSYLKKQHQVRTAYTRKIFHFLIFSTASIFQVKYGLPAVILFGSIVSFFVLFAVFKGDNFSFYEVMARESDRPHRTLFILIPLITTALGGVLSNLFFLKFAFIGYLVGGWGDAVGEPVGSRWGKHRYQVPSLLGVKATRSAEGSAAVAGVSIVVAFIGLYFIGYPLSDCLKTAVVCGLGGAAIESVSNHGLDNLTMQVTAAGLAYWLLA
jgi:phytol kinase